MDTNNAKTQISDHDRLENAKRLNLSLEEFDRLLNSANHAYETIKELGPFYGQEDVKEPTFRITAEPVTLPKGARQLFDNLGNDLLRLGRVLSDLPDEYKNMLGAGFDYRVPLAWRIDSIIDKNNNIFVNEVEGIDSVSALMTAEQIAYRLQTTEETTAYQLVKSLRNIFPEKSHATLHIVMVRNLQNNPFTPNARRFIELLAELSNNTIIGDLLDIGDLENGTVKPDWSKYDVVLNEAYCSPADLERFGVKIEQLYSAGNYHPLVNKGLFVLIHDESLDSFWVEKLGKEVFDRLKKRLIPSKYISTVEELRQARANGSVIKVSWAEGNQIIINRAKGIAMIHGDMEETTDDRWSQIEEYFNKGYKVLAQDFVEPAKIPAYLRKKGTNLEPIEWYNRICVKYVVQGNPNGNSIPTVALTAIEVTLGPEVVPAGRKCTFTAGKFTE